MVVTGVTVDILQVNCCRPIQVNNYTASGRRSMTLLLLYGALCTNTLGPNGYIREGVP